MATFYTKEEYADVYDSVTETFNKSVNSYKTSLDELLSTFKKGGISGQDFAKNVSIFISQQYAVKEELIVRATLEILKSKANSELLQAQIDSESAKADLIAKQVLTEASKKNLIDKQITSEDKKADKIDAEISLMAKQELTEAKRVDKFVAEIGLIGKQEDLIDEQITTEGKKRSLLDGQISKLTADSNLVDRERLGYDDLLRIKTAEFNGQVAFSALNAKADNTQEVVSRFNNSIDGIGLNQDLTNVTQSTAETINGIAGHNYTVTSTYWKPDGA